MSKKRLVSLSLVIIMLAILSFSSLAWFADSDSVTNKFNVAGGENENPDEIFSLDVMEKVDKDGDGDYDMDDATIGYDKDPNPVHEFTYENILPGDMLYKRPSAQNTGSYDQYIRFKVTIDNANDWVAVMQKYGYELHDLLYLEDKTTKLTASADWTFASDQTTVVDDKVTYVFYYNKVLEPEQWAVLFTYVKIPGKLTQQDMALFTDGKFQMVVTGQAVQTENLGVDTTDSINDARQAFAIVEADQTVG